MSDLNLWKRLLERPSQLLALTFVLLAFSALVVFGLLNWHTFERVQRVRQVGQNTQRIQRIDLLLQQALLDQLAHLPSAESASLDDIRAQVADVRGSGAALDPDTEPRLERVERMLQHPRPNREITLAAALDGVKTVLASEIGAQNRLLAGAQQSTRRELWLMVSVFGGLAAIAGLSSWMLRQRIVRPLRALRGLLSQLGQGEFSPVEPGTVDPLLLPLFDNYNRLVTRLEELETQHRDHARLLEHEVRVATQALLEQQRGLAQAERLGAVGEMAAELAHELRNPLAGILMSLENLRRDLDDPDLVERADLAVAEIRRLTRMLNESLSAVRHAPEQARRVDVARMVSDLVALLRYQIPDHVEIESEVAPRSWCVLPRDRIRQALLNLLLNAVHALGEKPGKVWIKAWHEDGHLRLSVQDDGPGFPNEILTSGAAAFLTRRESGTGLGLAMVRRVARDLGGELQLDNRDPHGAAADLVIPCSHA